MSPIRAVAPVTLVLAGVALVATGCESTQDKSAKIAAELGDRAGEVGVDHGLAESDRLEEVAGPGFGALRAIGPLAGEGADRARRAAARLP